MNDKVPIRRLPTGVPELDAVLGGGVPEFSFNSLQVRREPARRPSSTRSCSRWQARSARSLLHLLGEPPLKMLRYQQQFEFFDAAKVNASVRFNNLAKEALGGGLEEVLKRIVQEVEAASPAIVIVDSFRSVIQTAQRPNGRLALSTSSRSWAMRLTSWQATTFLVGEFQLAGTEDNPIFTVADGLVWLLPESRPEFDGAQDASHEDARPSTHSRPAYFSHYRPGHSGVSTTHIRVIGDATWRRGETKASTATAVRRGDAPRRDVGRRHSVRIFRPPLRTVGIGEDRPRHPVHPRRRSSRRTGRHCRVRKAPERIRADQRHWACPGRSRWPGGHRERPGQAQWRWSARIRWGTFRTRQ